MVHHHLALWQDYSSRPKNQEVYPIIDKMEKVVKPEGERVDCHKMGKLGN
jgi:hypothetical protein